MQAANLQETHSDIVDAYIRKTPASAKLAISARECFPSGVTHDSRYLKPHGLYVERGLGPHKWDVDGNRYIDYYGGHGALLLGHAHPEIVAATQEAYSQGTQFAAGTEREILWAEQIKKLVPCAERVRFTSSGTEATHLALRLARAFTGRSKVLRFRHHFHGWHDEMSTGHHSHYDGSPVIGVTEAVANNTVLLDPMDVEGAREVIAKEKDLAGVILEPLGEATGTVPVDTAFLALLRELTSEHGVMLIFDEVVTGFRVAPGGVQEATGITPDITTLAKIVAGGLPGGAVVGRKDIMDALDHEAAEKSGKEKIYHPGTFNANPVSAVAGTKMLELISSTQACAQASEMARRLRETLNTVLAEESVPWAAYGEYSVFQLFMNPEGKTIEPLGFDPKTVSPAELRAKPGDLGRKLQLALLVHGVDTCGWPGGLVSATHTSQDIEATGVALRESVRMLKREGLV